MNYRPIPELPPFTKADALVYRLFGSEEALAIRRLADEMTLRHDEHHPVIRHTMAEMAIRAMISYEPSTHGELMHAARLVSLSMLQSDLSHDVAQPTATVEQKIRLAGEVMRLERTICQSEKHFAQRQAARRAMVAQRPMAATPADGQPPPSTVPRDSSMGLPRRAAAPPMPATGVAAAPAPSNAAPVAVSTAAPMASARATQPSGDPAAELDPDGAQPVAASAAVIAAAARAVQPDDACVTPTTAVQTVAAAPTRAAGPAATSASATTVSAAATQNTVAAARPPVPAPAPRPPSAAALRPTLPEHSRQPPPGAPGLRTAAFPELGDPPGAVSVAVRDELARAMARELATGSAIPPSSPDFRQAAPP